MAGIRTAFRNFLLRQDSIRELCGARVHPSRRPRGGTLPAVTYYQSGQTVYATLDGDDGEPTIRLTVDCWAESADEAGDLADAIRAALLDEARALPTSWEGQGLADISVEEGGQDSFDPTLADEGISQVSLDVLLTYAEG